MALRSCKQKAHNVDGSSVEIEMEEIGAGRPKVSWCVGFFTDRHQCACWVGKLATVIASEMYGGESDVLESNEESDASLSSIDASEGDEDNDNEEYFTTRHYTSNRPSHTAQQALSSSQPSSSTNKENEVCCVMLCLLFV